MVAEKYGLDRRRFLKCFLHAWMRGKSSCKGLLVECRQKTENDALFLVTQDKTIIAQISLTETVLKSLSHLDLESFPWNQSTLAERVNSRPVDMQIKDINMNARMVNLKGKVVDKSMTKGVYAKFDGSPHKLSIATISDETGSIGLTLWNDQIHKVSVGDLVHVENGRVKMYRGQFQVSIGRNSKLNVIKPIEGGPSEHKHRSRLENLHSPLGPTPRDRYEGIHGK
jgi:replication factor A1